MARVHLTFDNGPHPVFTPLVLEVLARHGAKATFFVLGKNIADDRGRALIERVRDAGHRLGNHSYTHEIPLGDDERTSAVALELERTQLLLDEVWTGPRWFRPFGGGGRLGPHLLSSAAVAWLKEHRATCVLWNAVPGDWLNEEGWVEPALASLDDLDHAVIVLHDIVEGTAKHLDRFLIEVQARGHTFTNSFPEDCLPVVDGEARPGLNAYVRQL